MQTLPNIPKRIVVTGGPCAGKSTALVKLFEYLIKAGFTPIIVPEAATAIIMSGFKPGKNISGFNFQKTLIEWALAQEEILLRNAIAAGMKNIVLIYDRGLMDGRAYVSGTDWADLMSQYGSNLTTWRDSRYDAVMHLQTAAIGATKFYTLTNNQARTETPKQARALDAKTLRAWTGHPHLRVIENKGVNFESKMQKLIREVMHFLGVPVPLEIEKKYLLGSLPTKWPTRVPSQVVSIEQVYIVSLDPKAEIRIRKRGQGGHYTYYRTAKRQIKPGVRVETEIQIDEREYLHDLRFQKPGTRIIQKQRRCFVWKGQYLELDRFTTPKGINVLEVELTEECQKVSLPPWLNIRRDVTDDPAYKNAQLAIIH